MTRLMVRNRLEGNVQWAAIAGVARAAEPEKPVWPRIRALWHVPDEEFVRGLFPILLGRRTDKHAYHSLLGALRDGADRADIIQSFAKSPEAVLAGGDTSWLPRLETLSPRKVWFEVCRLVRADAQTFAAGLWSLLVAREPTSAELSRYDEKLGTLDGRAEIVRDLVGSPECAEVGTDTSWIPRLDLVTPLGFFHALRRLWQLSDDAFVEGLFELLLFRKADPAGFVGHRDLLAGGMPRPVMAQGLATTEEYRLTNQGDEWVHLVGRLTPEGMLAEATWMLQAEEPVFVREIHDLLVHRPPRPDELAGLRGQASAADRLGLIRRLAGSPECARLRLDVSWLDQLPAPNDTDFRPAPAGREPTAEPPCPPEPACPPSPDFLPGWLRRLLGTGSPRVDRR